MKMMPACCTRSTAARATLSMSTSFCSSSCASASIASGTGSRRFFVRPWNRPGSMSLTLMSTSSTDDPAMISNDGKRLLADVDLDLLVIETPVAQLLAQLLARALRLLADRWTPARRTRPPAAAAAAAGRAPAPPPPARLLAHLGERSSPPCRRRARPDRAPSTRRRVRRSRPR